MNRDELCKKGSAEISIFNAPLFNDVEMSVRF